MKTSFLPLILFAFLFNLSNAVNAAENLPTGMVIPKVLCKSASDQSYSLYLPSKYDSSKKWPVIICFDPLGKGQNAVTVFQEAAENNGFIVVGSNNINTQPYKDDVLAPLLSDIKERLSIDKKLIYFAGFAGGGLNACTATIKNNASGVIACSAIFNYSKPDTQPKADSKFCFFGTTSFSDLSLGKMKLNEKKLNELGIQNRLRTFFGKNIWAPKEVISEAVEWLLIQAMKSGKMKKSKKLQKKLYKSALKRAEFYEEKNMPFYAFAIYKDMLSDFKGTPNISKLKAKCDKLEKDPKVVDFFKKENQAAQLSSLVSVKMQNVMKALRETKNGVKIFNDLRQETQDKNKVKAAVAKQTLALIAQMFYKQGVAFLKRKDYQRAQGLMQIVFLAQPQNPEVAYNLACLYSLNNRKKEAVNMLKQAYKNGFTNIDHIKKDQDLKNIRGEGSYKQFIKEITSKPQQNEQENEVDDL